MIGKTVRPSRARRRAALCVLSLAMASAALGLPVTTPASASTVTARPTRTYEPSGTSVSGTTSPAGAPALEPGQYTDTLRADEKKNYTISLGDGVTPYVAVTLIRPIGALRGPSQAEGEYEYFTDEVGIGFGTASGVDCGSLEISKSQDRAVSPFSAIARPGRVGTSWGGVFSGPTDSTCGRPGKYVVSVTRTQSSKLIPNDDLPIEIVFIAEPPIADDVTALPPQQPPTADSLAPDITAAATKVSGGGSFGTAAELPKSGGYTDTIKPGETLFYRIRLGAGQRVGYAVRFHGKKSIDESLDILGYVATPFREFIYKTDGSGSYSSSSDETVTGQTPAPVSYRNRESDNEGVRSLRLPGYYYLIVTIANTPKPTDEEIAMTIGVKVAGEAVAGPKYRKVAGTSNIEDLDLPGQQPQGLSVLKVAYLSGGGLALALAALVLLLPMRRRRRV